MQFSAQEIFLGCSLKNFNNNNNNNNNSNNNNKLEYIDILKKKTHVNTSNLKFLFCEFLYFKIVV